MDVLFFISVGVASALIAEPFVRSRETKKRRNKIYEKEREEYRQKTEYNRAHLPSKELPPVSPDWAAVNRLIMETRFRLYVKGDAFVHYDYRNGNRKIPRSGFDDDTLKLIDMILKDVDWFYGHHTGGSVGECAAVLEVFLREKYSLLSAESVDFICGTYCINDR